jgi:hypothetical protein
MVGGVVYSRAGYVRDDLCLRTLHLRKELAAVVIDWEDVMYGIIIVAFFAGVILWAAGGIQ